MYVVSCGVWGVGCILSSHALSYPPTGSPPGNTIPRKATPVILHGIVSPVILHGIVSPDPYPLWGGTGRSVDVLLSNMLSLSHTNSLCLSLPLAPSLSLSFSLSHSLALSLSPSLFHTHSLCLYVSLWTGAERGDAAGGGNRRRDPPPQPPR